VAQVIAASWADRQPLGIAFGLWNEQEYARNPALLL
jgi:hypothetical protein